MMKKKSLFCLLVLITGLVILSCSRDQHPDDQEIIATVNREVLTLNSILEFTDLTSLEGLSDAELREKIEDLIKLTVLAQEAHKRGIDEYPEVRERIRIAEKRIKANALLASVINDIELTESEVFNHYQIHKSRYTTEREEYRIQRILLNNNTMADSVATMIVNDNLTFAQAARNYSQERSRETDGFVGYQTSEEMGPQIWNSLSNVSQYRFVRVPVSNGIYLVRYTDKRNRTIDRPFTEVMDDVREEVMQERRQDLINNLVNSLLSNTEIIISK